MWTKISVALHALVIVAVSFLLIRSFSNGSKVGYLDTAKLMDGSKDMQAARKLIKEEQEITKKNIDTLSLEFQNAVKDYERKVSGMSSKEKQMGTELLESKRLQALQYKEAMEQKAGKAELQKTQEVLKRINDIISEYGKTHGYKLILATSQGNIAYGDEGSDITEELIKAVNGK